MVLEPGAKVAHADEAVDDGQDDEENGQDSKGCQRLLDGFVILFMTGLVNADELEEEVRERAEVQDDGQRHSNLVLALRKEGGA